jgi:RimJ/RimL family protein N-acetyltransferase
MMLRTNGAPRLIGACGIGNFNNDAELGYWIGRPYWGLGFATEASRAVVEIAKTIGHKKLVASHFTDNPASGKVLRKLGFQGTGKTALRHSNGRGIATTCALYERSLEDAVTDDGDMRSTRPVGMREYMESLQAA